MTKIKPLKKRLREPVQTLIRQTGYDLSRINPQVRDGAAAPFMFDDFLDFWFSSVDKGRFYFVQIGAHDGRMQDPMNRLIHAHGVRGCLVEPQPDVFRQLKKTYKDQPQLDFVQAAIAPVTGEMTIYTYPKELDFPEKNINLSGFASFDRKQALSGFTRYARQLGLKGKAEDHLVELTLPSLRFQDLLKTHKIRHIDYLLIDAEGLDFEILKMIDFVQTRPRVIRFEHCCLSRKDRVAACTLLQEQGYRCYAEGIETMAVAF